MNSRELRPLRPLLVVDDDRKLCGLIRDYLLPHGWQVEMRHTGPEGLEAARSGKHEAVLLDVMMPGMDGFDVLRELRKSSAVPVLMLTAMGRRRTGSSVWNSARTITCRRPFPAASCWPG